MKKIAEVSVAKRRIQSVQACERLAYIFLKLASGFERSRKEPMAEYFNNQTSLFILEPP